MVLSRKQDLNKKTNCVELYNNDYFSVDKCIQTVAHLSNKEHDILKRLECFHGFYRIKPIGVLVKTAYFSSSKILHGVPLM